MHPKFQYLTLLFFALQILVMYAINLFEKSLHEAHSTAVYEEAYAA